MKNSFDYLTGRENPFLEDFEGVLVHKEIITPLQRLKELAKKEIGADLRVISGYRNYKRQEIIWNLKANGERKVLDDKGLQVNIENSTPEEILNAIMRFSAIPGASRHHWGSDIDIYDAEKCEKSKVRLTPDECEEGGKFFELHSWLSEKIQRDKSFGFYRPYKTDQGGVHPEAWHISHYSTSNELHKDYSLEVFKQNIELSNMLLKSEILKNPNVFYLKYLQSVDKAPF